MRATSVVLLLVFLALAGRVDACSCARRLSPAAQFAESELAFIGEVIDVDDRFHFLRRVWTFLLDVVGRDRVSTDGRYEQHYGFDIAFRVDRMWRGPGTKTVRVVTGRGGGDCGIGFERGKRYLVYAYGLDGDEWGTSICTRTHEVPVSQEDAAFLGTLKPLPLR